MLYLVIILIIVILLLSCCRVVPQNNEGLIETLGKYSRTVKAGLVLIIPVIQRLRKVSLAMFP